MWLSLVERCVRDAKAAGSNPVTSTIGKGDLDGLLFQTSVNRVDRSLPVLKPEAHILLDPLHGPFRYGLCFFCSFPESFDQLF